jgi:hypothetical protein
LVALFRQRRAAIDFQDAIQVVVTAMLLAPHFLYHTDVTGPPSVPEADPRDARPLDGFSLAARLSYALWAAPPDAELAAAADRNQLRDVTQILIQARRMLQDPRAIPVWRDFHRQWLGLDRLADGQREVGRDLGGNFATLAPSLLAETDRFVDAIFAKRDGHFLQNLLLSTRTTVDAPLARIYGLPPPMGLATVDLDAAQRAGILTQPSFLAGHANTDTSNPVSRGTVIIRRLLCIDVPDEPPNVDPEPLPPLPGNPTTRERYEAHGSAMCARPCHSLIDQAGFAFENFDQLGAFRSHEKGKVVDASGSLTLPEGERLSFRDAPSLARALGNSRAVPDCLARQWFRYLLRRREAPEDEPALQQALGEFRRSGDVRDLLVALVATPPFTHRVRLPGEGAP